VSTRHDDPRSHRGRVVVGVHPVRELLRAGRSINRILLVDRSSSDAIDEVVALAETAGIRISGIDRDEADDLAPGQVHQGVVALARRFRSSASTNCWVVPATSRPCWLPSTR